MYMKDLLVGLIEFFFENISNKDDYTLKDVSIVMQKKCCVPFNIIYHSIFSFK